jgi:hypothetical protein
MSIDRIVVFLSKDFYKKQESIKSSINAPIVV